MWVSCVDVKGQTIDMNIINLKVGGSALHMPQKYLLESISPYSALKNIKTH